jgi:tRNA threonylcarbamoyl adenosine modification protein (Sua5/YciO/YrdC/YwlC family)
MTTRRLKVDSATSVAAAAAEGANALRQGKLVGFATETVYGIAALATLEATMERLRELKSRPHRPFSVHIGRPAEVKRYVASIPEDARRIIAKAWPGPVTLLLPVGGGLADESLRKRGMYDVLCSDDLIGLRCPQGEVCEAMLAGVSDPIVAPSANPAGGASPKTADDVIACLDGQIDLLLDTGPTTYGGDSTILKFQRDGTWRIVREGVFDERTVRRLLRRSYIFVCTGNTCRSPLAAGIARQLLAEREGIPAKKLPDARIDVSSAGLWAMEGAKATPEAIEGAAALGADLSAHRSQPLSLELINSADVVFCMTQHHVEEVIRMAPHAADKVRRLDEQDDIPDPIGGGSETYRRTADTIACAMRRQLDKGVL